MARSSAHGSDQDQYTHTPLSGPRCIRILRLLPSKSDHEPLKGELFEISLDKNFRAFEATSYTWGSENRDHHIEVEGKRIAITKNCSEMLYSFRNPQKRQAPSKRRLWVDVVCMNQEDLTEKASQIEIMGDIYGRAGSVLVWLGPATPESTQFFKTVAEACGTFNPFRSRKKQDRMLDKGEAEIYENQDWALDVGSRPWFSRLWTVQEGSSPTTYVVLFCGRHKLLSGTFYSWYRGSMQQGLRLTHDNLAAVFEHFELVESRYILRAALPHPRLFMEVPLEDRTISVTDLMRNAQRCGALDPKDKIFALQSILQRALVVLPPIDYGRSVHEIYHTTTLALLRSIPTDQGPLSFLQLATGHDNSLLEHAPSWVPDFSDRVPPWPVYDGTTHCCRPMSTNFRLLNDGNHLATSAIVVDRIESASTQTTWHPDRILNIEDDLVLDTMVEHSRRTIGALQDWVRIASGMPEIYHPTNQPRAEAFLDTIGASRQLRLGMYQSPGNLHKQVFAEYAQLDFDVAFAMQKFQDLYAALVPMLGEDQTMRLIRSWISHDFHNDAQIWWSLIMANDPSVPGFSMPAVEAFLRAMGLSSTINDQSRILSAMESVFSRFLASILTICRGSVFFRTRAGYMGMGSKFVQDGDLVVLIGGMPVPLIVRPKSENFRLVSPAYIHGMMDGEIWQEVKDIYLQKKRCDSSSPERYYADVVLV